MNSDCDSCHEKDIHPRKKAKIDGGNPNLGKREHEPEQRQTTANTSKSPKEEEIQSSSRVEVLTSPEGESYMELGKQKRVTIRKFKGKILVDIREYYGKPGEEKPGKKGISLSAEQWQMLQTVSGQVDDLVAQLS